MKAAVLACLALVVVGAAARTQWHQLDGYTHADYMVEFGKSYSCPKELATRQALFEERLAAIRRHNADPTKTWKEGVNQYSDWTEKEFRRLLGYNQELGYARREKFEATKKGLLGMTQRVQADRVDWREKGVVTAVKDQGMCGSCWSFAATETLESHYAIKTGLLAVMSEQNILSCTPNPQKCGGTGGCEGGTAELAYEQLSKIGMHSEWEAGYRSYYGEDFNCTVQGEGKYKVSGSVKLPSNKESPLITAVTTLGPIAISVEASHWSSYETGVFDGCNKTNPDIDHAVVLVGFGSDPELGDYWLVRNSWSPSWGEQGYIRVKRTENEESACGTDLTPGDGSGCAGGPSQVKVCGTCGILYDTCYPTLP